MREEQNQLSSRAKVRVSLYCALALGFSPPDKGTLRKLSSLLSEVLVERHLILWPSLDGALKSLEVSIAGRETISGKASLNAEYHRLFVGPYNLAASPYASVYLESEPAVMGPSTVKVLRTYEEAGFFFSPSFKDLPDHIAAELEFMALLCEEEKEAWKREDFSQALTLLSREETFLKEHLVRWIPKFSMRILSTTDSPFYRALASLVQDYVFLDLEGVRAARRLLEAGGTAARVREGTRDGA